MAIVGGIASVASSLTSRSNNKGAKVPKNFNTLTSTPPYARTNQKGGAGLLKSVSEMNLPLILAIIAVAIVVIIIVVLVTNGSRQAAQEVPSIPISGLTDTSSPEDENQVSAVSSAPTKAVLTYEVTSGLQAWIEIYENDSTTPILSKVVEGPANGTYDVTGTLTFLTPAPNNVKVTVDGNPVTLVASTTNTGYYEYKVDFPKILAQWQTDNNQGGSSSSSAASSSNSSSASSSSSSGATAGSSSR